MIPIHAYELAIDKCLHPIIIIHEFANVSHCLVIQARLSRFTDFSTKPPLMSPTTATNDEALNEFINAERHPHESFRHTITGLMVQYYTVCERELWFMSRGVDIDRGAVNIRRGTHVDETSYRDKRDSFQINGSIQLDVLDSGEIMEVKVSSSLTEPARNQLLYYLWYLDEILDIQRDGVLAFPTERKRERVELTPDRKRRIETILTDIIEVLDDPSPPPLEKKPVCDACLYQDLCWM